jgi:hypothetical protein
MLERLMRRYRERLDSDDVFRATGHMHFGGTDRGGDAAVDVAFEKADGLLPWC